MEQNSSFCSVKYLQQFNSLSIFLPLSKSHSQNFTHLEFHQNCLIGMAHDIIDPTLILSLKRIRPIAPHLLNPLNGTNKARQVQKRQAVEEATAAGQPEVPDALQTLSTILIPPATLLRKRGPTENDSIQSGMHHIFLIDPRLRPNNQLNGCIQLRNQQPQHNIFL